MKINKKTLLGFFIISSVVVFFVIASTAKASILDQIKELLGKATQENPTVDSTISLASAGDLNKNGQVDSGDVIKFSYTITNPTRNSYSTTTLKTNVKTKGINSITNIKGASSLDTSKDTVVVPYLNISPGQVHEVSFEARVNFSKDEDQVISTDPELVDDKNSSLFKGQRQEVMAKKIDADSFNKFVHIAQ